MDREQRKMLATRIAEAREARRLTQKQLATLAGVSLGAVSNAERGVSVPQHAHLAAILKALGISLDGEATQPPDGWPGEIRVTLNLVGMWLQQVEGEERERRIDRLAQRIVDGSL